MRERFSSADTVGVVLEQIPLIVCNPKKPMERTRNGARYFRNPPQPHMCIQDYIEGCDQLCFINVLSWVKISTPRRPEDPIPLYGGMRVPYSGSAALTVSNKMPKHQPVIFAVMANPEILRLSGKTAQDPSDRDALVELMIDFVEAMNPDIKFKRQFEVLRDRDLAGELKDIWLAVQVKRERERGENGKRGDCDRGRESKEEHIWKEDVKHREIKSENTDHEREHIAGVYHPQNHSNIRQEKCSSEDQKVHQQHQNCQGQDQAIEQVQLKREESDSVSACCSKSSCEGVTGMDAGSVLHYSVASNTTLITPSTETVLAEVQFHEKTHIRKELGPMITNSWNDGNTLIHAQGQAVEQFVSSDVPKQSTPADRAEASEQARGKINFPIFSEYSGKDHISVLEAPANAECNKDLDEASVVKCEQDYIMDHNYHNFHEQNICNKREVSPEILGYGNSKTSYPENVIKESRKDNLNDGSFSSDHSLLIKKSKETNKSSEHSYHVMKSNFKNTSLAGPNDCCSVGDRNIISNYESKRGGSDVQVPNQISNSRDDLMPNVNDNSIVKFSLGTGQEKIVIP